MELVGTNSLTVLKTRAIQGRLDAISETEFTDAILQWAKVYSWRRFHVRGNTKRLIQGDVGFPDLVLVRPPRLIFAELKVGSNKLAPEQSAWLEDLRMTRMAARLEGAATSSTIECYLWRPEQWSQILVVLSK